MLLKLKWTLLVGLFSLQITFGHEIVRPTHANQLPIGTVTNRGYHLPFARVVLFNREALERDFPPLKGKSDSVLESWILENFAYINEHQLQLTDIRNTPTHHSAHKTQKLFIPPGVGRGAVIQTEYGLVDIKNSGNTSWNQDLIESIIQMAGSRSQQELQFVRAKGHSSGLETSDIAAAEYLRQLEIQHLFDQINLEHKTQLQTVESYFLIDLGFQILYPNKKIPAFLYGRQAHFGRTLTPPKHEIYQDKGKYQSTYFRTRIDFGGARTPSESASPYHEQLQGKTTEEIALFITKKAQSFSFISKALPSPLPFSPHKAKTYLNLDPKEYYQQEPNLSVIGRTRYPLKHPWFIDLYETALIKWTLFELSSEKRTSYLRSLGHEALKKLFYLSSNDFQIPLPEEIYLTGLKHKNNDIAQQAAIASIGVFERFPHLQQATIEFALKKINTKVQEKNMPIIRALLQTDFPFHNVAKFYSDLIDLKQSLTTDAVLSSLSVHSFSFIDEEQLLKKIKNLHQNQKNSHDSMIIKRLTQLFPGHFRKVDSCLTSNK